MLQHREKPPRHTEKDHPSKEARGHPDTLPIISERWRRTRFGILRRLDPRSSSDACSSGVHLRTRAAPRMHTISKLSDLSDPSVPSGSSSNGHSKQVKAERKRDMSEPKISTDDAPSRRAETTCEHDKVSLNCNCDDSMREG